MGMAGKEHCEGRSESIWLVTGGINNEPIILEQECIKHSLWNRVGAYSRMIIQFWTSLAGVLGEIRRLGDIQIKVTAVMNQVKI